METIALPKDKDPFVKKPPRGIQSVCGNPGGFPFISGLSKACSLFPSNEVEINVRVSGLSPLCSESQNGGLPGV